MKIIFVIGAGKELGNGVSEKLIHRRKSKSSPFTRELFCCRKFSTGHAPRDSRCFGHQGL